MVCELSRVAPWLLEAGMGRWLTDIALKPLTDLNSDAFTRIVCVLTLE
jgi:hypothetical protein